MANTTTYKSPRARRHVAPVAAAGGNTENVPPLPSAVLGRLISLSPVGIPQISVGGGKPMIAQVLAQVSLDHLTVALDHGTPILVMFIDGDAMRPLIIGVMGSNSVTPRRATTAKVDGQRVELTGQDEVVLRCGGASITLTKTGKVVIKGTYVVSGSSGANRITGGSVQIN